ncbi:formylglycine-generating enzyme family protein [Kaistella faecalis]|uniref:formylglycine-generating enzyme family protein n=1 Tax=Kaistella faecalis TaxID=2852098 RepID=UPI001C470F67|nr:formylglycine-generating enzyme family protein [Chryseobacterium faecale]UFK98659.1 formylglycine-generating enzyme family protein [Chryseobacterium faecale]
MGAIFKTILYLSGFFFIFQSCGDVVAETSGKNLVIGTQDVKINPEVKMVTIKGGKYQPFYGGDSSLVEVPDFLLDETPVTNREFLDFVKKNPKWKRSNVKAIFADETYLRDWQNDETLPKNADPEAPVTFVSWFAAKAYAKSAGKRLPTMDEWEYVAMADEETANARNKPGYSSHLINLYNEKFRERNRVKGSKPNYWSVYNMFDLVWEWTEDFNSIMTTSDSRTGEYDDKGLFCASAATSANDVLNYASFMRYAFRSSLKANYTVENLGFRCAKNLK